MSASRSSALHQSAAASTWSCGTRPRLGWVKMVVGLPEGPSYCRQSPHPIISSLCCPLNNSKRAGLSHSKIGCLSLLFFCLFLARILILLLLLTSDNVHSNSGPVFPCSVCARNVTWRGRSVQCCTCSKWVDLRSSLFSSSKFNALGSSHKWSCHPFGVYASLGSPHPSTTVISSLLRPPAPIPLLFNLSLLVTLCQCSSPSIHLCQCSAPIPTLPTNMLSSFGPLSNSSFYTFPTLLCFRLFFHTSSSLFLP